MVLIFSNNTDGSTNEVINWLDKTKVKWFRINETDLIVLKTLSFKDNNVDQFELSINGVIIDLTKCSAYWYRRGFINWLHRFDDYENTIIQNIANHLKMELKDLDEFIHKYLEETKIGINSFLKSKNNKVHNQYIAAKVGLDIPNAIITTNKQEIEKFLLLSPKVITKFISEGMIFHCEDYNVFASTSEVKEENLKTINQRIFPSLVQKNIEKFVELRIFFLHYQIYSMAIFSQKNDKTKLDFRNYDRLLPNRNVPFQLPNLIEKKIKLFMNQINLNSGSIDMILTPDNKYVFLEVNPIGQFGMVSIPCNYNIEKLIADYLSYGWI